MARKGAGTGLHLLVNPISAGPITRHIPGAHAVRTVTSSAPRIKVSGLASSVPKIKPPVKAPKVSNTLLMKNTHQGGQKKAVTKTPRRPLPPPNQKAQQPGTTNYGKLVTKTAKGFKMGKPPRVRVQARFGHGFLLRGISHRH